MDKAPTEITKEMVMRRVKNLVLKAKAEGENPVAQAQDAMGIVAVSEADLLEQMEHSDQMAALMSKMKDSQVVQSNSEQMSIYKEMSFYRMITELQSLLETQT
jgi:hypothetical protein